jgi:hypothetical protein
VTFSAERAKGERVKLYEEEARGSWSEEVKR